MELSADLTRIGNEVVGEPVIEEIRSEGLRFLRSVIGAKPTHLKHSNRSIERGEIRSLFDGEIDMLMESPEEVRGHADIRFTDARRVQFASRQIQSPAADRSFRWSSLSTRRTNPSVHYSLFSLSVAVERLICFLYFNKVECKW